MGKSVPLLCMEGLAWNQDSQSPDSVLTPRADAQQRTLGAGGEGNDPLTHTFLGGKCLSRNL